MVELLDSDEEEEEAEAGKGSARTGSSGQAAARGRTDRPAGVSSGGVVELLDSSDEEDAGEGFDEGSSGSASGSDEGGDSDGSDTEAEGSTDDGESEGGSTSSDGSGGDADGAAGADAAAAGSGGALRSPRGRQGRGRFALPREHARLARAHIFPRSRGGEAAFPRGKGEEDKAGAWGRDYVTYGHLQSLAPGGWCNDEPLNFALGKLNWVNEQAVARRAGSAVAMDVDGSSSSSPAAAGASSSATHQPQQQQRQYLDAGGAHGGPAASYVWNTFFATKLTEGPAAYSYGEVRRWTLRNGLAPRLRSVRYWVFPIHVDIHWALAVLDSAEGALHYFDSMAPLPPGAPPTQVNASEATLRALVRWYSDETADKLGEAARVDTSRWRIVRHPAGPVPQQDNGFDCGVFMLHFARCVAAGVPWDFAQADMRDLREALVYDILATGVNGGPPAGSAAAAAAGGRKAAGAGAGSGLLRR